MPCLVYNGKIITVLAGGKMSLDFANHIKGRKTAKAYRDNPEYVDGDGNIFKNCEFTSPSTAAQFVNGQSTDGYTIGKCYYNHRRNSRRRIEECRVQREPAYRKRRACV